MSSNHILVLLIAVFFIKRGSSQPAACADDVSLGIITGTSSVSIDGTLDNPVPVCIRCGALGGLSVTLFTDTSNVEYQDISGVVLVNNTNGVIITEYGLHINDPASTFTDGESIVCAFNDGSNDVEYQITFDITIFNPPPITPNVSAADFVEGVNASLTCTGDTAIDTDRYQWLLPDGTVFPENIAVADDGLVLELNGITRAQSGVYTCSGTLVGSQTRKDSNITVNVQYPAKVLSLLRAYSSTNDSDLILINCTFEGNPMPLVSWSCTNGTELSTNCAHGSVMKYEGYSILTVMHSTSDRDYTCTVENSLSSNFTTITIDGIDDGHATVKSTTSSFQLIQSTSTSHLASMSKNKNSLSSQVEISIMVSATNPLSNTNNDAYLAFIAIIPVIAVIITTVSSIVLFLFCKQQGQKKGGQTLQHIANGSGDSDKVIYAELKMSGEKPNKPSAKVTPQLANDDRVIYSTVHCDGPPPPVPKRTMTNSHDRNKISENVDEKEMSSAFTVIL